MNLEEKFRILSLSAKYDHSCTGSGLFKEAPLNLRNVPGIYLAKTSSGKTLPLLKILFTNYCSFNCLYCINRGQNDVKRASFEPEELVKIVLFLYKQKLIKGLFLSSGIWGHPENVFEKMLHTVYLLRKEGFRGYIHLKILPETSLELVKRALPWVNRLSLNIEFPSSKSLSFFAPRKNFKRLLETITHVKEIVKLSRGRNLSLVTQVIVGAGEDRDYAFLKLTEYFYKNKLLQRVYYSGYVPVNKIEAIKIDSHSELREKRLYQAEHLIKFYAFKAQELVNSEGDLDLGMDPKLSWALRHPEFFPVDIAKADYFELLRVPGIGPQTAKRILEERKKGNLTFTSLPKILPSFKKTSQFITLKGKKVLFSKLNYLKGLFFIQTKN